MKERMRHFKDTDNQRGREKDARTVLRVVCETEGLREHQGEAPAVELFLRRYALRLRDAGQPAEGGSPNTGRSPAVSTGCLAATRGPAPNYISHNAALAAISAGGRWLPWVGPSKVGGGSSTRGFFMEGVGPLQSPPGAAGEGSGDADDEGPVRRQGKVTVKYDRKELRKRLNLEEWILEQLTRLYDCQEEEIPELEIDVDELLDMESDDTRAARVKELLVDCYKPTEAFISGLLDKIRGMQKLSTPQKK
ncbi:Protein phosphatase 1 regulatory subunit 14B [Fukomys damarensis]|uniref:Protein phosphatase 1 regulatory subunit 14 n=1 Tax=Fukomys damarensis TaxID=885580 RepID=A0A091DBJ4_FUKDA|nr:Protein phosphatase 1 regulatory subunit 14B [Fukomys damarensis]